MTGEPKLYIAIAIIVWYRCQLLQQLSVTVWKYNAMYTASKERMAPEVMFLTEHTPQVSITDSKVKLAITLRFQLCLAHYTALQTKNR